MNLTELQRSLRQLRLGGMAAVLEMRLRQAQAEPMAPIDLLATLVSDELTRRSDRLLERRRKAAAFRDPTKTLDNFDFTFNPKLNRSMVFDLATGAFIDRREDASDACTRIMQKSGANAAGYGSLGHMKGHGPSSGGRKRSPSPRC